MSDKQERIMWWTISIAIVMLLFPPYFNPFGGDPHHYPDGGNVHVYGWFLSRPLGCDGVDMALQMAQLGILGLLSLGYILSLGKCEHEGAAYTSRVNTQNPDVPVI